MADELLVSLDAGVLTLTIDRAHAGNALTPAVRTALVYELRRATTDPDVRCVVVTGAGDRHFCTGADLRARAAREDAGAGPPHAVGDVGRSIRDGVQALAAALLDCEKPVIASVNGTAAGAGAMLVLAADLAIASERARLVHAFVRRGLVPDGGVSYLLARSVGMKWAKKLVLLGDELPASDALRLGLVNEVVPAAELAERTRQWASRLATGPTTAIAFAKRLLNRALDVDRASSFEDEAHSVELVVATADAIEGMASFVERREARFRGW